MEDEPEPRALIYLLDGQAGANDVVLWLSLIIVILTVAAATALRHFRWPRLERMVDEKRLAEYETALKNDEEMIDGLLVLRLVASITLLLAIVNAFGGSTGLTDAPAEFLKRVGVALLVFLGGVYGLVRGLARGAPERVLLLTLGFSKAVTRLVMPITYVMDGIGRVATRALGIEQRDDEQLEAKEDILDAVSEGERDGAIADEDREMIENIIDVRGQAVSQVMTPRTSVLGIPMDTHLDEAIKLIVEHGHSRVPVYAESIDDVRGVLYAKDVLGYWDARNGQIPEVAKIMRPGVFVPETKNTAELLEKLRREKVHMAIVVDEYGGMAGVVTIEDIIEEIVGEIEDEYDRTQDEEGPAIEMIHEAQEALVAARLHIDEFNDAMKLELPESDGYETLGGFLFHQMGRVPQKGESCQFDKVHFEILDASERRIHRVKVTVEE